MGQNSRARRTKREINAAIDAYLRNQCGRIAYVQLRRIGLKPAGILGREVHGELLADGRRKPPRGSAARTRQLERRQRTGRRPRKLAPRVYRGPGAEQSLDGKRWSAVLSAPRAEGLLDHLSACQLLGVDDKGDGSRIHVVSEGGGWIGPVGVAEHRSRSIPPQDRTAVRGIPSVILPRALIAAAEDVGQARLHDILDTAVRLGRYDGDAMVRVLEARWMLPGFAPLVAAVGALDETSGTFRSIFERRTMRLVETSRLIPAPVVNVLVEGYRPDLWWVGTRAIVECDGRDYHRSPAQIIADAKRQAILEARGFKFLRLRWADVVYDEDRTLARIEQFVAANRDAPIPGR